MPLQYVVVQFSKKIMFLGFLAAFALEIQADALQRTRYNYLKRNVLSSYSEDEIEDAVSNLQLYACDENKPELLIDFLAEVQHNIDCYEMRIVPRFDYARAAKLFAFLCTAGACLYYCYKGHRDWVAPANVGLREVECDLKEMGAEIYHKIEPHYSETLYLTGVRMIKGGQAPASVLRKIDVWKKYKDQADAGIAISFFSGLGSLVSGVFAYYYYAHETPIIDYKNKYQRYCMIKAKIGQALTEFEKVLNDPSRERLFWHHFRI